MWRRLAVSDIHGEGHRLLQVLEKAHYEPGNDRLFLLGDYIDRGTDSKRTVEIVQALQRTGAIVLMGNHDYVCVQVCRGAVDNPHWQGDRDLWSSQGGDTTLRDYSGIPPDDVLDWLANLALYHEEPDCILVHAGLRPGIPLQEQNPNDLLWIRKPFHEGYRGKRVIFGHTPTSILHGSWDVWHGPDKMGIDTGAVWGGYLTLCDLDNGQVWTA